MCAAAGVAAGDGPPLVPGQLPLAHASLLPLQLLQQTGNRCREGGGCGGGGREENGVGGREGNGGGREGGEWGGKGGREANGGEGGRRMGGREGEEWGGEGREWGGGENGEGNGGREGNGGGSDLMLFVLGCIVCLVL